MRQLRSWSITVLVVSVLCLVGWTAYAQRQDRTHSAKWEYKILRGSHEEPLNQLGAQGWELVGVTIYENQTTLYLKRAR